MAAELPAGDAEGRGLEDVSTVEDELMDSVEGALRLKRIISQDEGAEGSSTSSKKRRVEDAPAPEVQALVGRLLTKWGLEDDAVTKYVLDNLPPEDLGTLTTSTYWPDRNNMWKSTAELVQTHANMLRENYSPGGGPLDVIHCFKFRHKLDYSSEALLRSLTHKDLRYVMASFAGSASLEGVAKSAKEAEPDDELCAPDLPGAQVMSRYSRMEVIDPLADCVVFGDANLSFALQLARLRKALGHVGRVIATTFETLETLRERYQEIDETIKDLEEHFADVYHATDCTRIAVDKRFEGLAGSLGAVYYNFPHAGAVGGFFDGHPLVNWRHENLMRLFFRALRSFVKPGGVVKVSSNSGAVGVRYSYIVGSALENEFRHVETMPFLEWHLHRYGRAYGDRRDTYKRPGEGEQYNSQRADSDMVYCFEYHPSGKTLPKQHVRHPPPFRTIMSCVDGPFEGMLGEEGRKRLATDLYKRFVTEVSGTHVG